jgi:uncharacterized membrane protein (DUF485 family)
MFSIDTTDMISKTPNNKRKKLAITILELGLLAVALLMIPYLPDPLATAMMAGMFLTGVIGFSVGMVSVICGYFYLVFVKGRNLNRPQEINNRIRNDIKKP